jgi:predicted  nucleic acid-binding Zn-ribbon protein
VAAATKSNQEEKMNSEQDNGPMTVEIRKAQELVTALNEDIDDLFEAVADRIEYLADKVTNMEIDLTEAHARIAVLEVFGGTQRKKKSPTQRQISDRRQ